MIPSSAQQKVRTASAWRTSWVWPSVCFRTPGSTLGRALLVFASCHVVAKALARALFGNLSAELFSRWSREVSRHEEDRAGTSGGNRAPARGRPQTKHRQRLESRSD